MPSKPGYVSYFGFWVRGVAGPTTEIVKLVAEDVFRGPVIEQDVFRGPVIEQDVFRGPLG